MTSITKHGGGWEEEKEKTNTWRKNNQWIKEEIRNYLETNENTVFQNVWNAAIAVLEGN